jgi:hypothetical protein
LHTLHWYISVVGRFPCSVCSSRVPGSQQISQPASSTSMRAIGYVLMMVLFLLALSRRFLRYMPSNCMLTLCSLIDAGSVLLPAQFFFFFMQECPCHSSSTCVQSGCPSWKALLIFIKPYGCFVCLHCQTSLVGASAVVL